VPGEIDNISFALHKGEILGFGGLSECGMHEVGKAIFGGSFDRKGSVTLRDGSHDGSREGIAINSIPKAIRHGVAYASKDRDNESVVLADSILDQYCLPSLDDLAHHGLLNSRTLRRFAQNTPSS